MKTDGIRGFHAYLQWDCRMFVYHIYESLIDPRLYKTGLNICHLWRHRIRGIRYSWFHADAILISAVRLQAVRLSRIWESNRSTSLQSWSLLSLTFKSFGPLQLFSSLLLRDWRTSIMFLELTCISIVMWVSSYPRLASGRYSSKDGR